MTVEQEKGGKIKSKKEKGKRGKGGRISNIEHPISNYEVRLPRFARNDKYQAADFQQSCLEKEILDSSK